MNTHNNHSASEINADARKGRCRFCDKFGFYGLLCFAFFGAFVAMIELGGRF